MKNTILFCFLLIAVSCNSGGNGNNNPTPNQTTYYDVPNWDSTMLYGQIVATNTTQAGTDSMLSYTKSGVAYIKYRGVEYKLKAYDPVPSHPALQNDRVYFIDVFDSNNNKVFGGSAQPKKYVQNGQWVTSYQALTVGQGALAPFNDYVINGGVYAHL